MQSYHPETQKEYNNMTTKLFKNSLVNIPLFAVPAFAALFGGQALDEYFGTGDTVMIVLLFLVFTSSWFIVLRRNTKLTKEYKLIRDKMKQESSSQ